MIFNFEIKLLVEIQLNSTELGRDALGRDVFSYCDNDKRPLMLGHCGDLFPDA